MYSDKKTKEIYKMIEARKDETTRPLTRKERRANKRKNKR